MCEKVSESFGGIDYEKSSQNSPLIIDHAHIDDLFIVMRFSYFR